MIMNRIAVPFIQNPQPLENYKTAKPYVIKTKLLNGEKLTRDEKNYLTDKVIDGKMRGFSASILLMGWAFDFKPYMKRYLFKHYGHWYERYAIDKTALRQSVCGKIDEIYEIPKH